MKLGAKIAIAVSAVLVALVVAGAVVVARNPSANAARWDGVSPGSESPNAGGRLLVADIEANDATNARRESTALRCMGHSDQFNCQSRSQQ